MSATPLRNKLDQLSRKDFLTLTWKGILALSGLLSLGGLAQYLGFQTEPAPPAEFDLGLADAYPPGSRTQLSQVKAILIHSDEGFKAISMVCPHLGCMVEAKPEGFLCPCHGSGFDPSGTVQRGPAAEPLPALRVELREDGHLILYT